MNERMSRRSGEAPEACKATIVDVAAVTRVLDELPGDEHIRSVTDIFAALSDPTRLRVLLALAREDLCVCDLAAVTGVSSSAVSHQLRVLRDRRLVSFVRDGKRAVYRLADEHVATLLAQSSAHAGERT
jgi:ArsR family transcriptional regulator, lead/cadmium/zinc/bismuth-responsive transcriptional repressor